MPMVEQLMTGAGVGKGEKAKTVEGLRVVKSTVKWLGAFVRKYLGTLLQEGWVGWDEGEEEGDEELSDVMVDNVGLRNFVGVLEKEGLDNGGDSEVSIGVLIRMVDKAGKADIEGSFGR